MTEYDFILHLSADEYLHYYKGVAKAIQVESTTGKSIRFPAHKMREFVLAEGIHGLFRMTIGNNKIISIRRLR